MLKRIFFFLVTSSFSIMYAISLENDFSIINSFLILLLTGSLFFRKKKLYEFYVLSFLICISFMRLFLYSYELDTGNIFIPGGDAKTFYNKVISIANGDNDYFFGRYKLFLAIVSSYYKLINFMGLGSNSPYHFILLSSFFVSVGNVFVFKISKILLSSEDAKKVFFTVILFPIILKYGTGTLREVFAYPFIFIYIYNIIKIKKTKLNYLFMIISIVFISGIRLDWLLSVFGFTVFYYIFGFKFKKRVKNIIIVSIGAVFFLFLFKMVINYIGFTGFDNYDYEKLNRIMNDEDNLRSSNSISTKLMGYGIIGRLMLFLFAIISPFPPPIIKINVSYLEPLLISLASIYYYFNLPVIYIGIKKATKVVEIKRITYGFIGMVLTTCLLLAFTTVGTYRHKLFLFPIFLIYIPLFDQFFGKRKKQKHYGIMLFVIISLLIIYTILK